MRTFFLRGQRALLVGTLLAALAGRMVLTAQGSPEAAKIKSPVAATPGSNAEGGSGSDISPPAPDLTDSEWKHGSTDGEIFSVIKNGVPPELNMEPWGDRIGDTDIWNIVNYLRSLAKKP